MVYITNRIITVNVDLYKFLNDVNYGMTKPQFHHLSIIINGLINLSGTKSLAKILTAPLYHRDKQKSHTLMVKEMATVLKMVTAVQLQERVQRIL